MKSRPSPVTLAFGLQVAVLLLCGSAVAQTGCTKGYRVLAVRWDAVLAMGWETRQDCTHPEWPARSVAASQAKELGGGTSRTAEAAVPALPLIVHAGDLVRFWKRDEVVRIEMSGVAEKSARSGERVMIRITRLAGDAGVTADEIPGIVRGSEDVEMQR